MQLSSTFTPVKSNRAFGFRRILKLKRYGNTGLRSKAVNRYDAAREASDEAVRVRQIGQRRHPEMERAGNDVSCRCHIDCFACNRLLRGNEKADPHWCDCLHRTSAPTDLDQSLIQGLREQGYVEGVNLTIEWRYADGDRSRVPQAAKDLAGMKLDAIVTTCTPTTRAMVAAAPKTPIVMAAVSDPIGQGLIASYQHPGGRITGTASQFEDLAAKMFQLLHETAPNAASIAVLFNPNNPVHKLFLRDIENAAQLLSLKLVTFPIGQPDNIDTAFEGMRNASAVMVLPDDSYLFNLRRRIIHKLEAAKLPSMFGLRAAGS